MTTVTACVVLVCFLGLASAQIPSWGRCKNPPVVANFNISKITGVWYEFERYYTFFERGLRCNKGTFVEESAKGCIKIQGVAFRGDKEICYEGIAYSPDSSNLAKMMFKPLHMFVPATRFWLLDTDYRTHAIFYTCVDMYFMHWDIIWIKSRRQQGPPAPIVAKINRKIAALGFRTDKLRRTDQTRCNYSGNCDQSPPTVDSP